MISLRSTVNLSAATPVACRGPFGEALTSESVRVNEKLEPSSVLTEPTIRLRVICTPVVRIARSQSMTFASIFKSGVVTTHGPVYGVNAVPSGTPVLAALGKPPGCGGSGEPVGADVAIAVGAG